MDLTVISREIPTADTGEKKILRKAKEQVTQRDCVVSISEGFQDPTG